MKRVVIVGKPNVGKSRLFNRLTGEKHSVVFDEGGTTRDRVTLMVSWGGNKFLLTDTGGYSASKKPFQGEINNQTEKAIFNADLILFLISPGDGIGDEDLLMAKFLRRGKSSNVLLVANKCDRRWDNFDHYRLGLGEAIRVSAEHGINTGPLLNTIIDRLGIDNRDYLPEDRPKISILGRTNVGKSTLINCLLGEDRVITSDVDGTTRDAIDLDFTFNGKNYVLIDTPGIRRISSLRGDESGEKYSILRSKKSLGRANFILFMLDMAREISELDERIGGLIYKANIPTIFVVNKWDLSPRSSEHRANWERTIRSKFPSLRWVPMVFISALGGIHIHEIFRTLDRIILEKSRVVDENCLQLFLTRVVSLFSIPMVRGRKIQLYSIRQVRGQVPTFLITCNDTNLLHFSYSRLIENQIRKSFLLNIVPITVIYKNR